MPTDEERMAFKRQEREAAASIMAGDRYCPDPELHELVARAASQERPQPDRHENGFAKCDTCGHLRGEHHNRRPWEANREDARLRCYHSNGGMVADCACREFVVIDHEGWCNLDPAHAGRCRRSLSTDTPEEPSDG